MISIAQVFQWELTLTQTLWHFFFLNSTWLNKNPPTDHVFSPKKSIRDTVTCHLLYQITLCIYTLAQ